MTRVKCPRLACLQCKHKFNKKFHVSQAHVWDEHFLHQWTSTVDILGCDPCPLWITKDYPPIWSSSHMILTILMCPMVVTHSLHTTIANFHQLSKYNFHILLIYYLHPHCFLVCPLADLCYINNIRFKFKLKLLHVLWSSLVSKSSWVLIV